MRSRSINAEHALNKGAFTTAKQAGSSRVVSHANSEREVAVDSLTKIGARLKAFEINISRLDGELVEQDIAARRLEAESGWEFAKEIDRIETALKMVGGTLDVSQRRPH